MLPLITERIYTALTGDRSVHLCDWPEVTALPYDRSLVHQMDLGRDVCSSVLTLREAHRRRTRLPLKELIVAHPEADVLENYREIIAQAINVKNIVLTTNVSAHGSRDIKVNSKLGARIGSKFKEVLAAQRARNWKMREDGCVEIAGMILGPEDFELRLQTKEGAVAEPFDSWRGVAVLDTKIYPELQAEGWARDFVRIVQTTRKKADFKVTDRINIAASVAPDLLQALVEYSPDIKRETLAVGFDLFTNEFLADTAGTIEETIDQYPVKLKIERIVT
jgi:isoleucyl-tRNA synthetase